MRRYTTLLMILLCTCLTTFAQGVAGDWEGTLSTPMGQLKLILHLKGQDEAWSATFDSPMQGAYGLKANAVTVQGSQVDIEVKMLQMRYKGAVSGDELKGEFVQGGMKLPLSLSRIATKAPAPAKPFAEREVIIEEHPQGIRLAGTLTLPKDVKASTTTIIFITGSGAQNRDEELHGHNPFAVISDSLTRHGFITFRYDDRGVGASTGKYDEASMNDLILDAQSVLNYISKQPYVNPKRIVLLGHSEGGYIAARLASQNKQVAGVISLAGPAETFDSLLINQIDRISEVSGLPQDVRAHNRTANETIYAWARDKKITMDELSQRIEAYSKEMFGKMKQIPEGQIPLLVEHVKKQVCTPWFREFISIDPTATWRSLRCPVIGAFGSKDLQVLPTNAARLQQLQPKAKVRVFDGLNHLFQPATTGLPMEYGQIKTSVSPEVIHWLISTLHELNM